MENTSDTDWKDVNLSLVSGRPISFIMDLYSPLYATRPVVQPELYANLRPRIYDQDLGAQDEEFQQLAKNADAASFAPAPGGLGGLGGGLGGLGGGLGGSFGLGLNQSNNGEPDAAAAEFDSDGRLAKSSIQQSVDAAAQGGDVGELFRYEIATPVTLARQQLRHAADHQRLGRGRESLDLQRQRPPQTSLEWAAAEKHYQPAPDAGSDHGVRRRRLRGRFKDQDLPPGSERLMSYAMDLDVEVAPTSTGRPQQLAGVRIEKGVLYAQYKLSRAQSYVVKNSGEKTKTVLIEYPLDLNWTLVKPEEPSEKTRDMYRFALQAEPGKPADLAIEEARTIQQTVAINNLNENSIQIYLSAKEVSQAVKDALTQVIRRKASISELGQQRDLAQRNISAISQEQNRIRQNMGAIDRSTDLYSQYVEKLTEQEDEIAKYRKQIDDLSLQILRMQTDLDDYLMGLVIE